jgi:hypothetical protein
MEMLLAGDDPTLDVLRKQFRLADVTDRQLTGVGFYVTFSVPSEVQRVEVRKLSHLGDVKAEIEGLQHGAGFVLHLSDGAIRCLEGYSYDEPWPANADTFCVSYIEGDGRDWVTLWKKWAG